MGDSRSRVDGQQQEQAICMVYQRDFKQQLAGIWGRISQNQEA